MLAVNCLNVVLSWSAALAGRTAELLTLSKYHFAANVNSNLQNNMIVMTPSSKWRTRTATPTVAHVGNKQVGPKYPDDSKQGRESSRAKKGAAGTWICSGVHWSRLTDLTLDMCTPRFLWMPAHLMQIKTPRFHEAHLGPVREKEPDPSV